MLCVRGSLITSQHEPRVQTLCVSYGYTYSRNQSCQMTTLNDLPRGTFIARISRSRYSSELLASDSPFAVLLIL